eukprot:TRINITY_DN12102_c0_g1_i1.p1 TRINITY_DN12102_c0_g1~~TRINITY_DN12102_c0_g1_i1.p1  ORF type:complete len:123 (-),score=13.65 TRINITY_DN12102_c0_g1_i1:200-568(-)
MLRRGVEEHALQLLPGGGARLYRGYINRFAPGDHPRAHRDAAQGSEHVTCLIYANGEWPRDWGGETVFYDERHEISHAVRPRAGRAVLWKGGVIHSARPPLADAGAARFTIALKWAVEPPDL